MGKKYIIELPEKYILERDNGSKYLQIPVADSDRELKIRPTMPLTPYTEPDTEAIEKEAYQRGLDDAWEAVRKILMYGIKGHFDLLTDTFPDATGWWNITQKYTASEAIEKIRAYEEKKKAVEIKVGDEVMLQADHEEKGICINKQDNKMQVMWSDGSAGEWEERDFIKTGRHFPELVKILKKMGADE